MRKYYKQAKHQIDKKVFRQDRDFSTRLNYAIKKIKEFWMNIVSTTYYSTHEMIDKLQQLKGKTKRKLYKSISKYYDNMNIRFDEDPFAKNAQGVSKIYHEVLKLMNFLQIKPQVKNMNIYYYDLDYTVIEKRGEKEKVDDKNGIDFIDNNAFITPNQNISIKVRETILS